jgi:hypothetical protein
MADPNCGTCLGGGTTSRTYKNKDVKGREYEWTRTIVCPDCK